MGYRLHVSIPNVKGFEQVELGKQYENCWDAFNDRWFGEGRDEGMVSWLDALEFYEDLVTINSGLDPEIHHTLYNLEILRGFIEAAIEEKYVLYFQSY